MTLRASRPPLVWEAPASAPKGAVAEHVWIGADANGLGFEVAVARWADVSPPSHESMRSLHSARLRNRAVPLCVVLHSDDGRAWIYGPATSAPVLGPIPSSQAARIVQAGLDEPSASAARARLLQSRESLETADIPGFDPQGLFAIRELTYGVPRRPDWATAVQRSRELMATNPRGQDLIRGLGFESRSIPGNAHLLTVGREPARAVAILLRDSESFDAESARFAKSPIYHGLESARQNNVPWLVVVRGPQLRLYSTSPDVGVSRRGATQTYFGLDLALLDDEHAGYLDLVFSGPALVSGGSVDELLAASRDYAVALGDRLRERIYDKVVAPLSVAVARGLATDARLDEQRLALGYRLTLRILFRLLFQAYAEDTRLLPLHQNARYTRESLKALAHDLAENPDRPHDDPQSTSLWDGLMQVWRVIDSGDRALGVPAYNGGLFGTDPELHPEGIAIAELRLHNDVLGPVLAGLLVDEARDGGPGPVDFRALDVRDFGTIYEGLLESGLSIAASDLSTDAAGAWLPALPGDRIEAAAGEPYFHTKSGDRKATGSYFTKPFAVEHLLERALDPAIDVHLTKVASLLAKGDQVGAARLFFDFRVADLAMGSGHFLVAAIGHIEAKFGSFLESQPIPGVERELLELKQAALGALSAVGVEAEVSRSALLGRQIARRCVYGLDINELAVDLARLAIWVRTFVPGLPMSSLDHQLVPANSLTGIGTVEEAVEALDPDARDDALTFSGVAIQSALDKARALLEDAAALKESTREESQAAQATARDALEAAEPARLLFDAAIAVRLGLLPAPGDFDAESIAKRAQDARVQHSIAEIAPAHFPLRFPEVFLRSPSGFDVLLGNPPWEKVKVEADKWWGARIPRLFTLPVGARDDAIQDAKEARPDLADEYEADVRRTERMREVLRGDVYPGLGRGDVDLYQAFAWRNWQLLREHGRVGLVTPRSLISEAGADLWRERVFDEGEFSDVTLLLNSARWAFDMEPRYSIALLSLQRLNRPGDRVRLRGPFASRKELDEGLDRAAAEFPAADFRTWGSGAAFPALASPRDGEVYRQMRTHPRLDADVADWRARAHAEFHSTADKPLFQLDAVPESWWPLYKGESFDLWQPDTGKYYGGVDPARIVPYLQRKRINQSRLAASPFSEFPPTAKDDPATLPIHRARIAFRKISRATDSRSLRIALVPPRVALTDGSPYLLFPRGDERAEAYVLGILSSVPADWMARRVVEVNMNYHVLHGLAVPRVESSDARRERVTALAGRLAAQDARFAEWAGAVGVEVGRVTSNEKADLIAELDALAASLFGLTRHQIEHIFATFHRGWNYEDRLARVLGHFDRWEAKA